MSLSAPVRDEMDDCPNPWCDRGVQGIDNREGGFFRVSCTCGVGGPASTSEAAAISLWNTRTPASQVEAGEVERLRRENQRLQRLLDSARARSKQRGADLLEEEATAALSAFGAQWEPLRDIARRAGVKSAAWLASRARDLQRRGLVESRWIGAERTQFKVWRSLGRPVPVHASGPGKEQP